MLPVRTISSRLFGGRIFTPTLRVAAFFSESSETVEPKVDEKGTSLDCAQLTATLIENKKLLKERNEFEDKYKRALAESENVRKRMLRQVDEAKTFGIQSFCKDLLEVADILSKATESISVEQIESNRNSHFVQLYEGLKMTDSQLIKVFSKHNLHKINPAVGEKFDPNFHEAMFTVPITGENKANTIANVSKIGYRLHERTLRPAFVGVFVA